MLVLFTITSLVNSALLFVVEPMFAKMILPLLGGSPSVWNTCLFFFQATLLAGYAYAHVTTTWLGVRIQAALHTALLLLVLFTLPIGIPTGWPSPPVDKNPIPWLLVLLLVGVGFPFFLLSATTPMLQKWFTNTRHPSAKDPYFLYAASNLGSLLALLGYPALLEPHLRLVEQAQDWSITYGMLLVLIFACAAILLRPSAVISNSPPHSSSNNWQSGSSFTDSLHLITAEQRTRWLLLSFAPSSLTLGATTYLTMDITPIPLLWVIPLALYLLTFILAFAKKSFVPEGLMIRLQPFATLLLLLSIVLNIQRPLWFLIVLHLLTFFVNAMVCHQQLAGTRPSIHYLTEFYLWISVGGVLGGVFNALLAPLLFTTAIEYPLVLALACCLSPTLSLDSEKPLSRWLDYGLPLALGALVVGLTWAVEATGLKPAFLGLSLRFGVPAILCFSFRRRPIRFGLGLAAILLLSGFYNEVRNPVEHKERTFFGIYRVKLDPQERLRGLIHGTTLHGLQSLDENRRLEPLSYFYRTSPIGQLFAAFSGPSAKNKVAIIGLGVGSMACYGESGQEFTFYEIDPAVLRIANNPRYFTFLKDCPPEIEVVIGDARLSLKKAPDRFYGLIIMDAFTSDAVPVHLLTREAIELYLKKLADGGILAFNISNRNLNLRPVFESLAREAGLVCLAQDDLEISETEHKSGKAASQWVVMARNRGALAKLLENPRWRLLPGRPGDAVWTDDFSNILSIIRWN